MAVSVRTFPKILEIVPYKKAINNLYKGHSAPNLMSTTNLSQAASLMGKKGGLAKLKKYGVICFQEMAKKSHLKRPIEKQRKKIRNEKEKI